MKRIDRNVLVGRIVAVLLVVLPVGFVAYQWIVYRDGVRRAEACGATFVLGESEHDLAARLSAPPCAGLEAFTVRGSEATTQIVRTPIVFGARNWYVRVELRAGVVAAIRYRTADDDHEHPKSAPADRVAER